jgi:ribosomal protein L11 methylase PrmA
VDLDPRAIDAARGNLRHNQEPGSKIFLALGELSCAQGPFCLVLANLVPTLHVRAWKTLWRAVAPGGWLILSGFCDTHKDSILHPYVRNGATEKACSLDQVWAGILLLKPDSHLPSHS